MYKRKRKGNNFKKATILALVFLFVMGIAFTNAQQFQQPYPGKPAPDNAQLNTLGTLNKYLRKSPTAHQTVAGSLLINPSSPAPSAYLGYPAGWPAVQGVAGTNYGEGSLGAPLAIYGYSSEGPISYGVYGYAQGLGSTGVIGKTESGRAGQFWGTVGVQNAVGGQYDLGFDGNGIISEPGIDYYTASARDSQYLYLAGIAQPSTWRIEKRNLSDGSLVYSVNETIGTLATLQDIAIDDTFLYAVGWEGIGVPPGLGLWRIEKRFLSNGSLDTNFGDGDGIVTDPDATFGTTGARAIEIDEDYMYVGGFGEVVPIVQGFRLEKRKLSDGTLCGATAGCDGIFDDADAPWAGSSDGNGDGVILAYWGTKNRITDIAIDEGSIYLTGTRPTENKNWYLQKRQKTTGFPCNNDPSWGCGSNWFGELTTGSVSLGGNKFPQKVIYSTASRELFIVGYDNDAVPSARWRIEKRASSSGAYDTEFDNDGILDVTGLSGGSALATEDTTLFLAIRGNDGRWRVEKRNTLGGSFKYFATGGLAYSGAPSSLLNTIVVSPTHLYVAGAETNGATTIGRVESRFIEKAGTAFIEGRVTATAIMGTSEIYATPGVAALNGITIEGDNMQSAFYSLHGYNTIQDAFGVYGYSALAAGLVASSTAYNNEARGITANGTAAHTPGGAYAASVAWNAVEATVANPALYALVANTLGKAPVDATPSEITSAAFAGVYASGGAYAGYFDGLVEIANGFLALNNTQLTESRLIDLLSWCGSLCQ